MNDFIANATWSEIAGYAIGVALLIGGIITLIVWAAREVRSPSDVRLNPMFDRNYGANR